MILRLTACSAKNSNSEHLVYGTMVLKDNILLEFIEEANVNFLKIQYGEHFFPIKPNTYDVIFLDETDEQCKSFNAKININNSLPIYFFVKLTPSEKQQLKWMNKQKWIQKDNNVWYVITAILTLITLYITNKS
jgi:hypothetical protein